MTEQRPETGNPRSRTWIIAGALLLAAAAAAWWLRRSGGSQRLITALERVMARMRGA